MIESDNELKSYIEKNLNENFVKLIDIKDTAKSKLTVFEHKNSGKKIVKRVSTNHNDDVFRTLKEINNKNLVNILEVCSDDEHLLVLEDYVEGKNLLEVIESGNLKKKEVIKYAMQICDALTELHKNDIIHRDIKPENVIITNDDNAVLIDFSISKKQHQDSKKDTEFLGTVGYAAPEQFGITQSNKTTDLYSLGVLLNIMLTGEHPTVSTPKGFAKKIINKATATQISKRYQSASQLKKDLYFLSIL